MVVSQNDIASDVGWQVIKGGGNAVDAAVATAFALAVTHPTAGNIGGGGFLLYRAAKRAGHLLRLPRGGAGRRQRGDVAEGRQVRLRPPPQQPSVGRRARHGRGPPPGVEGTGLEAVEGPDRPCRHPGPRRLRGEPWSRPLAGLDARGSQRLPEVSGVDGAVLEERQALRGRRHPEAARPGPHAGAHRRPGPGRVLRGRDRRAPREGDEGQRRPDHARRPQEVPGRRSATSSRARIAATS